MDLQTPSGQTDENSLFIATILNKLSSNKKLVLTAVIALVLIISAAGYVVAVNADINIHKGVFIDKLNIGGLDRDKALELIKKERIFIAKDKAIKLSCEGKTIPANYDELGVRYDYDKSLDKAYKLGRGGNAIINAYTSFCLSLKNENIALELLCDNNRIKELCDKIAERIDMPAKDNSYNVKNGRLVIQNGVNGKRIDKKSLQAVILAAVNNNKTTVEVSLKDETIKPIEVDELYNNVVKKAVDAKYEERDGKWFLNRHQVGVSFDKATATEVLKNNINNNEPYYIPVTIINPTIYATDLENKMFKDRLAYYTSKMTNKDTGRVTNVKNAAASINGTILNPDEIFSYNNALGPVTSARGYKEAIVYVGNKMEKGVGGGICQISSTLYSATLFANLDIVRRINHSLTVGYVPFGQDATVSSDEVDFRFRNNTKYPIKIVASADYSGAYVTILGTKSDDTTINVENITQSTTPFNIVKESDASLPMGQTKIKQAGMKGYVIDTYRIISKNGQVVKREYVSKSIYATLDQIELVGEGAAIRTDSTVTTFKPSENVQPPPPPVAPPVSNTLVKPQITSAPIEQPATEDKKPTQTQETPNEAPPTNHNTTE